MTQRTVFERNASSAVEESTSRVLKSAFPTGGRILLGVLSGIGSAAAQVALLAVSTWLIVRASEQPPVLYLTLGIVGVRAFAILRSVLRYTERLSTHEVAFKQLASIRVAVLRRLIPVAPDGTALSRDGDLRTRFVADVDDLQNLIIRVVQPGITALIVVVAACISLSFISPVVAVCTAVVLIMGILMGLVFERGASLNDDHIANERGAIHAAQLEQLRMRELLFAYQAENDWRARLLTKYAQFDGSVRRRNLLAGISTAVTAIMGGVAVIVSIFVASEYNSAQPAAPWLAAVCLVPLAIAEVAATLPPAFSAYRMAHAAAARIATAVPSTKQSGLAVDSDDDATQVITTGVTEPPLVALRRISAHWPGSGEQLHEVTLTLKPGERVLLRGVSGAGKTLLAHVLVRFSDYTGSYTIGGVEARDLHTAAVRRLIGLVEQQPWMFDETVRQNLIFASESATDDELLRVLDRVGLSSWLAERGGLDARVGERGALVSGGQAQRIALARALLADFPILILDEPVSSVDAELSQMLMRDILRAASGKTILLISHTEVDPELIDRKVELVSGELRAISE